MLLGLVLRRCRLGLLAIWRTRGRRPPRPMGRRGGARAPGPPRPPETAGPLGVYLRPLGELGRQLQAERQRSGDLGHLLETLVEALPDPVLVIDRDLLVTRANGAARRALDFERDGTPLGRALRDPGVLAAVNAALTTREASTTTFSPVGDRSKQFAARIEPIRLDHGRPGVLLALREQTEQVMIERMRSDFVANASHEIRTPLASLIGFIETLQGPAKDDPAAREAFLATMAEEARRMARLIDDLLSLSRIELAANRPPAGRVDPCDPGARGGGAHDAPCPSARRSASISTWSPACPSVRGDSDQLHQLVINLVSNAIKYGGREQDGAASRLAASTRAASRPAP